MKENLEDMLHDALIPSEEPDATLNQHIINSVRKSQIEAAGLEMEVAMRKSWVKGIPAIALAAAVVVSVGGLSAYAAWRYQNPKQVAEELGDKKLMDAFGREDAINIDESQSYGGYTATLLGMISGKKLSQYEMKGNGEIKEDRTYAVLAIKKDDGSDFSEEDQGASSFLVSPLIKGENPSFMNIYFMNGGVSAYTEYGVRYGLVECDNLEAFAGRGVYLCVTHSTFYESEAYIFDEESGEITRNEDYDGLNALFKLPLDVSKADEKAADEQLRKWRDEANGSDDEDSEGSDEDAAPQWDEERLQKDAEIIQETVETLTPDKDGYIYTSSHKFGGMEWGGSRILVEGENWIFESFEKSQTGMSPTMFVTEGSDGKDYIETYSRNEDGTITVAMYHEK